MVAHHERRVRGPVHRRRVYPPYVAQPPPPPVTNRGGLGFNFTGPGSANELLAFIRARKEHVTAPGKRQRVHVIINEPGAVAYVASADPEALIIYRVHFGPGRDEPSPWDWKGQRWSAQQWFEEWIKVLHPGIRQDGGPYALTFKNEVWRPELAAFHNEFDVDLMRICTRMGVRCTYGNYSVAVFQPHPSLWPGLRSVVKAGAGTGHVLSGNTYWFDDAPERFVYMGHIVEGQSALWCHGEVGWAANDAKYQPGRELELAARHDAAFVGKPGYVGGALWCINGSGGGWQHSHFINWDTIAKR